MKNFVFDIGNVLAEFPPHKMLHQYLQDPALEQEVYAFLFPKVWDSYDQGLLREGQIVRLLDERFPGHTEAFAKMMNEWTVLLKVRPENLEAVRQIGHPCYILSNLPEKAERSLADQGFFDLFDGALCSWREKLIKPDPEIFRLFLKRYDLKAEECFFIDDKPDNVKSAASIDIRAVHLDSIDKLRDVLEQLGAFDSGSFSS